ncbi:hypothetical protein [Actinoplanes lobatus]|uniref:Uncharacterized protein n=1 Tax=Actinoplanes lobatus TaxID=113568 RepID=A0A7W7HB68_9ACTN|nr:hypothetical protein [Actinoplanes lobatus]MBB4747296.1 hypothetical protein [Actinoplanes lobatus]
MSETPGHADVEDDATRGEGDTAVNIQRTYEDPARLTAEDHHDDGTVRGWRRKGMTMVSVDFGR